MKGGLHYEVAQGTEEWRAVRLGKLGASRVADAVARTKTGWGASRANLMADLIAERLTGRDADSYTNAAMQWGTDHEAEARIAYEYRADIDVLPAGFVDHPTIAMAGASPDGFAGDAGLVEIKCPNTAGHIDTLLGEPIAGRYSTQMQWQMACTGRAWCDFVSFDPRLPEAMRVFIKRVTRDDATIKALEEQVVEFLADLDRRVAALAARYAGGPSPNKLTLVQSLAGAA